MTVLSIVTFGFARCRCVFFGCKVPPDEDGSQSYCNCCGADTFGFAFRRVRVNYVTEISDATLIDAAIRGVRETKAKPGSLARFGLPVTEKNK